jgi:hypothetical protein
MPTLPELTLQLSRDLSANHQNCLRQLAELESGRMTALQALPGTAAILADASEERMEAALTRDRTLQQVDLDRRCSAQIQDRPCVAVEASVLPQKLRSSGR